ncbi:hypothetical protein BB561_005817, partial [Smittium simulii]
MLLKTLLFFLLNLALTKGIVALISANISSIQHNDTARSVLRLSELDTFLMGSVESSSIKNWDISYTDEIVCVIDDSTPTRPRSVAFEPNRNLTIGKPAVQDSLPKRQQWTWRLVLGNIAHCLKNYGLLWEFTKKLCGQKSYFTYKNDGNLCLKFLRIDAECGESSRIARVNACYCGFHRGRDIDALQFLKIFDKFHKDYDGSIRSVYEGSIKSDYESLPSGNERSVGLTVDCTNYENIFSTLKRLSGKFTETKENSLNVSTWAKKFKLVAEIKKWDEATQLKVLELWLGGKSSECFQRGIKSLISLAPEANESIPSYNARFTKLWGNIPTSNYTDALIRDTYLSVLAILDQDLSKASKPGNLDKAIKVLKKLAKKKLKANQGSLIPRQISDAPASISNVKLFRLKPEPIQNMGIEIKALEKTNSKNYLLYNQNTLEDLPKTFAIVLVAGEDHSIEYKVLKQLSISPAELSNPHYIQPVRGPIIALNHKARLEIKIYEDFAIGANFFAMSDCKLAESLRGSQQYNEQPTAISSPKIFAEKGNKLPGIFVTLGISNMFSKEKNRWISFLRRLPPVEQKN